MYSEVELRRDEADTIDEASSRRETLPLIPLSRLRRTSVRPPSFWTSLRIAVAVMLARLAYRIAP